MDLVSQLRAAGCVFAEDEAALLAAAFPLASLPDAVARRVAGEPLEHILGWVAFAGLRLEVAPGVFVPRVRTELVARLAVEAAPRGGVVVDLCCGVGAIAAAVAAARPDLSVVAADIDPVAVAVAARNLAPYGATALVSDMDGSLPRDLAGAVDVVTACPPYVPTDEIAFMPSEARDHEPRAALDGGSDGTDLQAAVFAAAARLLRPGGTVIVETSEAQAATTSERAVGAGLDRGVEFSISVGRDDELGAIAVSAVRRSVTA